MTADLDRGIGFAWFACYRGYTERFAASLAEVEKCGELRYDEKGCQRLEEAIASAMGKLFPVVARSSFNFTIRINKDGTMEPA